jgi:peptidyl-prolyl cis-trans isomerase B (cyclophilin B)
MRKNFLLAFFSFGVFQVSVAAQIPPAENPVKSPEEKVVKKANTRPEDKLPKEKFDDATVAEMALQCVQLRTEKGDILIEFFPESAPETVRNFLNLTALGAFDTTTFNRVVPDFIIQGGSMSSRETRVYELDVRARRKIPDEPSLIKHERGIVSMARGEEPNTASSNFFILVGTAGHLDGKFAAFGRVLSGMEVVEAINKMPVENEKPESPVRISRAIILPCGTQNAPIKEKAPVAAIF